MRRHYGLSHVLELKSKEAGKKRIQTKEENSICERKSRGCWGSGGWDKQEGNGIFFLAIGESFLPFTDNIAFPWNSWYILWRLITFQQWGALCARAVWCTAKQWICLHISPIHWQKPIWVQQNCSPIHLALKKSLTVAHQWCVECSGAQTSRSEGEPHLCWPWINETHESISQECQFLCMQVKHLPCTHLAFKRIGLKLLVVSLEAVLHLFTPLS